MASVEIPLTRGKFAIIDEEDLKLISRFKWHAVERDRTWYAATSRERRRGGSVVYMHRLIASPEKSQHVDHVNGNGLDNRRENLRACSNAENRRNMRKAGGRSRFKGVSSDPRQPGRPWTAYINRDNRRISLGAYETEEEAARAYNAAALELHGEFARINVIEGLSYEESVTAPDRNRRPGRRPSRAGSAA